MFRPKHLRSLRPLIIGKHLAVYNPYCSRVQTENLDWFYFSLSKTLQFLLYNTVLVYQSIRNYVYSYVNHVEFFIKIWPSQIAWPFQKTSGFFKTTTNLESLGHVFLFLQIWKLVVNSWAMAIWSIYSQKILKNKGYNLALFNLLWLSYSQRLSYRHGYTIPKPIRTYLPVVLKSIIKFLSNNAGGALVYGQQLPYFQSKR